MHRERVGEERGSKETDGCTLTPMASPEVSRLPILGGFILGGLVL
jgi:hypothetical protein